MPLKPPVLSLGSYWYDDYQDEILANLSFKNVLTGEFWLCMILLLIALWVRIYIHYGGAYAFLRVAGISVTYHALKIYTMIIEYPVNKISVELGVILCGNLFNTGAFILLMLASRFFQFVKMRIPKIVAIFISSYGLAVMSDFLLIALIDIASLNTKAEIMKLYNFYNNIDNSGIVGIFIILFLYFGLLIINAFLLYTYLLYIHMDGRIIDIYVRMTADDSQYYVPNDSEVSAQYLKTVLNKIKTENQGQFSNPILVSILHYDIKDPSSEKEKRFTYISLYKMVREDIYALDSASYNEDLEFNNDSKRLVFYRHFLRNEKGSIIELGENIEFNLKEYPLLDKWPTELRKLRAEYENDKFDLQGENKLIDIQNNDPEPKEPAKEANNEDEVPPAPSEGNPQILIADDPFKEGNKVMEEFKEEVKE